MPRRKLSDEEKWVRKIDRENATAARGNSDAYIERQRELHRLQQARWAKANRDCIRDAQRKWKEKNPDYHREADRDRYARDAEKIKARRRAYYAANKERINAAKRAKTAAKLALRKPTRKIGPAIMPTNRV